MPESRLQRTRATLPEGYQYGDARHDGVRLFLSPLVMERLRRVKFPNMYESYLKYREFIARQPPIAVDDMQRWFTDADATQPLSDEEFKEKYIRPAVEHDPQGAADLIERWRAPHENAAAQLKRRADADFYCFLCFSKATLSSGGTLRCTNDACVNVNRVWLPPSTPQRTGDEAI